MLEFRNDKLAKINSVYKPSEKIQKDREMVYLRYSQMKQGTPGNDRASLEAKWDKWEKQYEGWRPPKNDDWQSTIIPPFTTTVVERSLAEMVDQTIQPKVAARGKEDEVKAKIVTHVKDYTWEVGDGDIELYKSLKQYLILGNTIWQEDYWQDKRKVNILTKFNFDTNEEEYEEKEIVDFDDVYGETVDLRNFFIDPMARSINNGRYKANDCIRRYIMNYDTFLETFKDTIYDQFGAVKYVKPGGDLNYYQYYSPPNGIDKDNQVEVLWYWGRRPDKLIIVANDVVIKDGPNPFNHKQLPFAEASDVPRLNQFWSRGEPELLESIQDELTTLRRMRIDRQHMDIWKMFLVSNRETLDDEDAIVAPSKFIYVDDPTSSIKPLEYNSVHPTAYREEELLKQDGREVTGIESPQPSGTATEAAIFKESTMKALRLKIWLTSRTLLTNIMRLRVANISQFYSVPKVVKIVGEKKVAEYRQIRTTNIELKRTQDGGVQEAEKRGEFFFVVTPDLVTPLYGSFDFKPSGEPTFPVSKPLQQQKTAEFMQHPIIQLAIQAGYYDPRRMADELSEINDFDPEDFRSPQGQEQSQELNPETQMELANRENEMMAQGQPLPGTGYVSRPHTDVHLAFMSSQTFIDAVRNNPEVMQIFIRHIKDEEQAQLTRKQGLENQLEPNQQAQGEEGPSIMAGETKASMPARMVGGEGAPSSPSI